MINRNNRFERNLCSEFARNSFLNKGSLVQNNSVMRENTEITSDVTGCGTNSGSTYGLAGYPLASVFAPLQDFDEIYNCETGLSRGTIFTELDLPFVCGGLNGGVSRG